MEAPSRVASHNMRMHAHFPHLMYGAGVHACMWYCLSVSSGAGVRGWCNPSDEGYGKFWPALSAGSWLHVLKPAGHNQFLDVKVG